MSLRLTAARGIVYVNEEPCVVHNGVLSHPAVLNVGVAHRIHPLYAARFAHTDRIGRIGDTAIFISWYVFTQKCGTNSDLCAQ